MYKDKNFRDVGESINQCYAKKVMKEGVFFRSNGWFSGWDCSEIGSPDTIISLNFDPEKSKMFFCWDDSADKTVVGKVPTYEAKLDSLEFMDRWSEGEMRSNFCKSLNDVMEEITRGGRTLIHCDAGRDRTGFVAALLAAVTAEHNNMLDDHMRAAIECDYRKTESLQAHKFGNMERFIKSATSETSLVNFLSEKCAISKNIITDTAEALTLRN